MHFQFAYKLLIFKKHLFLHSDPPPPEVKGNNGKKN